MRNAFPLSVNSALPPSFAPATEQLFWADIAPNHQGDLAPWQAFLCAVAASSPYLRDVMLREADFLRLMMHEGPDVVFPALLNEITALADIEQQSEVMRQLRLLKHRAALLIALADIGGVWDYQHIVEALTDVADHLLRATVDWLLKEAHRSGKMHLADLQQPTTCCGYTVLAMGKQGADELNYSSDIDLIILYDPEAAKLKPQIEPAVFFVRMTKQLVQLLQDVTEDGYALRVDLRLRPDPRATQVAIALEAAAIYYENMGQNWERAAMIKARAVAGDIALGCEFLNRLKPYIWRKNLDFAAIADVQALKRQIHAVKGHGEIAILGHNVKLGRGGIREIEFFVQTQQLIAGGRNPKLRGRQTLGMLQALCEAGWITPDAASSLRDDYRFLRTIEHRLQMVADEQTQLLPATAAGFAAFARFAGYAEASSLQTKLQSTFENVQRHYAALFEQAGALSNEAGNLVFTGGEDDPETLETLSGMGYERPSEVAATIRGWHFGRYAATRSARAREALTELIPAMLKALARGGGADRAFLGFDQFLSRLPAGLQLFSMLQANPRMLDLIAMILGSAPRLAEQVASRPSVLDAVLDPGFFGPLLTREEMEMLITSALGDGVPLEELADRARVLGRELKFRIGVRILTDTVSAEEAGLAYSNLAEVLVQRLHRAVQDEMAQRHGTIAGGSSCVVAMGKLGGCEMTASSDLDLMIIYDGGEQADFSNGPKPLSTGQYYAKLAQRLITLLSAPTTEGVLYDVDMRLRPSGSKGPVATSYTSFIDYQRHSAWTWEKLALTRARVISGEENIAAKMQAAITAALREGRNHDVTITDVVSMRAMMLKEHGSGNLWDIKGGRGGLVELEFIAQTLQLLHAPETGGVLATNTLQAVEKLQAQGFISQPDATVMKRAGLLLQRLTQVLRLALTGDWPGDQASPQLQQFVARAAAAPDLKVMEALLGEEKNALRALFDRLIGHPAA